MTAQTLRRLGAACLLIAALSWPVASAGPAPRFRTTLTQADWTQMQAELRRCNVDRAPYHRTYQSLDYDHVVWVLTPYARVGHYVRESHRLHTATSYEEAQRIFDPTTLVVRLKTQTFTREKSLAVRVLLKTDAGTLQPLQEELTRDTLTKVGYYGKQYYIVEKRFAFDLAKVASSATLTVVVLEADGDQREIPFDPTKLQ